MTRPPAKWVALGKLVGLTPFRASHITEEYRGWLNDPKLNRYLSKQHWTAAEAKNWVGECLRNERVRLFAVCRRRDSKHVGNVKLERECEWEDRPIVTLGILIGEPGRGYGAEAIRLAMGWAYRQWDARVVRAGIVTANAASIAAFAKAGFNFEPEVIWARC